MYYIPLEWEPAMFKLQDNYNLIAQWKFYVSNRVYLHGGTGNYMSISGSNLPNNTGCGSMNYMFYYYDPLNTSSATIPFAKAYSIIPDIEPYLGTWIHFRKEVKWTWREDAYLRLYVNDKLVVDERRPTTSPSEIAPTPFFAFGLYKGNAGGGWGSDSSIIVRARSLWVGCYRMYLKQQAPTPTPGNRARLVARDETISNRDVGTMETGTGE